MSLFCCVYKKFYLWFVTTLLAPSPSSNKPIEITFEIKDLLYYEFVLYISLNNPLCQTCVISIIEISFFKLHC